MSSANNATAANNCTEFCSCEQDNGVSNQQQQVGQVAYPEFYSYEKNTALYCHRDCENCLLNCEPDNTGCVCWKFTPFVSMPASITDYQNENIIRDFPFPSSNCHINCGICDPTGCICDEVVDNEDSSYYDPCVCNGFACSCNCQCPCVCLCDCPHPIKVKEPEPAYEVVHSYKHRDGPHEHVENAEDGCYGWVYCYFGLDPKWKGVYRVGVTENIPDWLYTARPEEIEQYGDAPKYAKYKTHYETVGQTHTLIHRPCMWQLCYAKKVYDAPRVLAHFFEEFNYPEDVSYRYNPNHPEEIDVKELTMALHFGDMQSWFDQFKGHWIDNNGELHIENTKPQEEQNQTYQDFNKIYNSYSNFEYSFGCPEEANKHHFTTIEKPDTPEFYMCNMCEKIVDLTSCTEYQKTIKQKFGYSYCEDCYAEYRMCRNHGRQYPGDDHERLKVTQFIPPHYPTKQVVIHTIGQDLCDCMLNNRNAVYNWLDNTIKFNDKTYYTLAEYVFQHTKECHTFLIHQVQKKINEEADIYNEKNQDKSYFTPKKHIDIEDIDQNTFLYHTEPTQKNVAFLMKSSGIFIAYRNLAYEGAPSIPENRIGRDM